MVSSSLHKPSAADMGVVRGVTEHSKWTSQTLRGASSGLPLMPPNLASGTERKCCRTRRGHRRSQHWSACHLADCRRKGRVRGDRNESPRKVILRNQAGKDRKEEYTFPLTEGVFSCWLHERSILPSFSQTSLLPFPIKKSLSPLTPSLHCLSNDLSVLPFLLHGQLNVRPIG